MLKHYLKIAVRYLFKQKVYSLINVFGLAVGMACCLLIALYVYNEWSYDEFHSNSDRIYRTWVREDYGEGDIYFNTVTPLVLKPTLERNIPEIEAVTRRYVYSDLVKRDDESEALSESIHTVDPDFFRIFDFELIRGEVESIFSTPDEVVLTPSSARRYFGSEDPLQQTMLIRVGEQFEPFTVTGIIEEPPSNSSITYDMIIPFANSGKLFSERAHTSWFNVVTETYVLLDGQADREEVEAKFPALMRQVLGEEEYNNSSYTVGLQPLTDIHQNIDFPAGIAPVSDPMYSYILGAIALLILVIACVNFITLSISRSTERAREVGIRKTVGAQRRHLMYQYWGEALLMTVLAFGCGFIISELLLPFFNTLSGTELALSPGPGALLIFAIVVAFISLFTGIYPALILSGFRPAEVLKGKLRIKGERSLLRRGMVVFQFTLSIFLIAATLIVTSQLEFLRSKNLGYQKEQMVVIQTDVAVSPGSGLMQMIEVMNRKRDLLKTELSAAGGVSEITASVYTPVQPRWVRADFRDGNDRKYQFMINFVDEHYLQAMEIDLTRGRHFSEENPSDARRAVIVNEALVEEFGLENPVGSKIPGENFIDHEIIGVTENFNYESLHSPVRPLAISINPQILLSGIDNIGFFSSPSPRITLKLATDNLPSTMDAVRAAWERITPEDPFNYTFLDQAVDSRYRQEERLSKIVGFGSTLAIIIASLGLFGLAALMVVRRTKEIGVRKVLGATASQIVLMVNKEFTGLVVIAFVLAVPFTWYALNRWLQDFAYRVELGIGVFILAGLIALAISWMTVSYQSVKAALINPVDSLRNE